jgi:hypothetical protein
LLDAVRTLYRLYMGQVISNNMRVPVAVNGSNLDEAEQNQPKTFNATLLIESQRRMLQHRTPKIILQSLLGSMIACAIAAYALMWDMKRLLYHEPYSTAGVASLFAGGKICTLDSSLENSQGSKSKTELDWTWRKGTFGLGWWNDGNRQRCRVNWGLCDIAQRSKGKTLSDKY